MAEQLSDDVYKPWLKGNFSELNVNNSNVKPINYGAYLQTHPIAINLTANNITPSFELVYNKYIVLEDENTTLRCQISGDYYFSYTLIFDIQNSITSYVNLSISIQNTRTQQVIKTGGVFNYDFTQKLNLTGILHGEANDLFIITVNILNAPDITGFYAYGWDSDTPSQLAITLIN